MTWPAPQAEAWMRANPGRWLVSADGKRAARCFRGQLWETEGIGVFATVELSGEWRPPREHYAAEVEATVAELRTLIADYCTLALADGYVTDCPDDAIVRILFPAAPEES